MKCMFFLFFFCMRKHIYLSLMYSTIWVCSGLRERMSNSQNLVIYRYLCHVSCDTTWPKISLSKFHILVHYLFPVSNMGFCSLFLNGKHFSWCKMYNWQTAVGKSSTIFTRKALNKNKLWHLVIFQSVSHWNFNNLLLHIPSIAQHLLWVFLPGSCILQAHQKVSSYFGQVLPLTFSCMQTESSQLSAGALWPPESSAPLQLERGATGGDNCWAASKTFFCYLLPCLCATFLATCIHQIHAWNRLLAAH